MEGGIRCSAHSTALKAREQRFTGHVASGVPPHQPCAETSGALGILGAEWRCGSVQISPVIITKVGHPCPCPCPRKAVSFSLKTLLSP